MQTPKCNFHTHTTFCDGNNSAEEMVLAAIQKGFTVLGFSGHSIYPSARSWHIPVSKLDEYVSTINALKEKYSSQIKIYCGFEADYFPDSKDKDLFLDPKSVDTPLPTNPSKKIYKKFKPDFLIGSVHYVNTPKGFYSVDSFTENVQKNLVRLYETNGVIDGKKAVQDYFEAERQMLKKGDFEILGHPDLIRKRNGVLNFFKENEDWYIQELKDTAKLISRTGCIAEINSGAIARGAMDDFYPSKVFLDILYSYKVPVCVNSDAHDTKNLDCAYERAYELAKKTGYTELVYPDNNIIKL